MFNKVGYDGTDSNRIARAAGFAPGTFYNHFTDKRAIFIAVYRDWVEAEFRASAAAFAAPVPNRMRRATLVKNILDHHRSWKMFRASLRALSATDKLIHAERIRQRERQIEQAEALLRTQGAVSVPRARIYGLLLILEIVCDAVADGDTTALGIADAAMTAQLEAAVTALADG